MTDAEWIACLEDIAERMRGYSREASKYGKGKPREERLMWNAQADTWIGAAGLVQELIHKAEP